MGLEIFVQFHRFDNQYPSIFLDTMVELLNQLRLKILPNPSHYRYSMILAIEYNDFDSHLFVFFRSVFIFYNRNDLPEMGNRNIYWR